MSFENTVGKQALSVWKSLKFVVWEWVNTPASALTLTGNKKKIYMLVQKEIIPQPGGADTSNLCLANLHYKINVCAKF